MIAEFRNTVSAKLSSADVLEKQLQTMPAQDWDAIADIFAARFPEFDVIVAMPDAQALATSVAKQRGVPLLMVSSEGQLLNPAKITGETVLLTTHLRNGQAERSVCEQADQQGLKLDLLGAAIERTNLGARDLLEAIHVRVRAVVQLADTTNGLVFERRTRDRWTTPQNQISKAD